MSPLHAPMAPTATAHSSIVQGAPIEGVMIKELVRHSDNRGSFMEVFQDYWDDSMKPVQWSMVESQPNVLRGPHLHLDHDEYIMCVSGEVFVGLKDMRPHSTTYGVSCMIKLTGESPAAVIFPAGLLHGWCFTKPSLHLQAVSESYRDYHPHDNFGCLWSDPDLGLTWPITEPVVADRAANFPSLNELEATLKPLWK